MNIQRATPVHELLAKLIFLILPTTIVAYFLLLNGNQYFGIIGNPHKGLLASLPVINNLPLELALFLSLGMIISALFHAFRFRFLTTFFLLSFFLYSVYKTLDHFATGEFDAFFISIQFLVFSVLLVVGWIVGWGFMRIRYWAIGMGTVVLVASIGLVARSKTDTVLHLMLAFAPAICYATYIIFAAEQIYQYKGNAKQFWWFLSWRLIAFSILCLMLLIGVYVTMRSEIKETVANFGGGGKAGNNSMLKQNKDGSFNLKDYARLQSSLGRSNQLLFAAHIDNFFPNSDIPNPLYLTAFYYTKFDTLTETFERDSTIPYNDLFEPDPASIPLFSMRTDSSVIKNSLGNKLRKTVEIQVYSKELSPHTYLAPNTGFFVQPITIEKDFRDEFISAFRAKSYVSELNSAYFIYNPQNNLELKKFQEQRFDVLRRVYDYSGVNSTFLRYYTFMPTDAKFQKIAALAAKITAGANTPVDKVLKLRDWFLSKDETGEPLFKYTDNPGVPDIPSASKLMYFLFENRQGYCAYYAGATLFMLRSLGIPSRIAVGFLTVDRSDKNKGWYWYYADQAHAWVQVYFPGFGWLDFDTTVGNSDARESPKPDGTPPMQPPRAWLAAEGLVEKVDTLKKRMTLQVRHMVFHDKEYNFKKPVSIQTDLHIATIKRDSVSVLISDIKYGEQATAVSYADALKAIEPSTLSAEDVYAKIPTPTPIDEVYLQKKAWDKEETIKYQTKIDKGLDYQQAIVTLTLALITILLFIFLLPIVIYRYFLLRYSLSSPNGKPYWIYRATTFWLHQMGISRGQKTVMQFAEQTVDPQFETNFAGFMRLYLKQKYSHQSLSQEDLAKTKAFLSHFKSNTKNKTKLFFRIRSFLRPLRSLFYFYSQTIESE
ncbi:MAG: transglutaminase domain-containing protein [Bacteroidetes bacterium]|nr:transglutaminase domain-containing protein [Bacteroidota bacterium]MBS1740641.1 transglutaminase domain-containing protein [Bacteroidota bacterium]